MLNICAWFRPETHYRKDAFFIIRIILLIRKGMYMDIFIHQINHLILKLVLNPCHLKGYMWTYSSTQKTLSLFYGCNWCIYEMITCLSIIKRFQLRSMFNIQFSHIHIIRMDEQNQLSKCLQVITIILLFIYQFLYGTFYVICWCSHLFLTTYNHYLPLQLCNWSLTCSHF